MAKYGKKSLTGLSLILIIASIAQVAEATQTCQYCKRRDTMSGFLYSYSYCPAADGESDKCIEDAWNYINSQCSVDLK